MLFVELGGNATLGSGLGLSGANPWSFVPQAVATFTIGAGIWLIVMQWLSSALGGYLAGRLRKKWVGVRTDEVFFRDTAHGLLAWALATAIVAVLFTLGSAAVVSSAARCYRCASVRRSGRAGAQGSGELFHTDLSFANNRRVYRLRVRSARWLPPRRIVTASWLLFVYWG